MSTKDKRISFEEKGKYPFFTPEGYFDDLTARIMKQIPEADTAISSSKVIGINGTKTPNRQSTRYTQATHECSKMATCGKTSHQLLHL